VSKYRFWPAAAGCATGVDHLETLWTGSLEEGRFNNVAAFEYVNLMGSAYQFDVDRQRYLCRAG
jgi:hypothetical protein